MLYTLAHPQLRSTSACCTTATRSFVRLSDGSVRNAYTVRLLNKRS